MNLDLLRLRWRHGSDRPRNIYAIDPAVGHKEQPFIALVETAELAAHIIEVHNRGLAIIDGAY